MQIKAAPIFFIEMVDGQQDNLIRQNSLLGGSGNMIVNIGAGQSFGVVD